MKSALVVAKLAAAPVVELTGKEHAFVQHYAEHGNAIAAYRDAYEPDASTAYHVVKARSYELAHRPSVRAAIRALQDAAAESTVHSIRSRMTWLQLIVDADPSELQGIVGGACRRCWADGGYHWRDAAELAAALDKALKSKGADPMPQAGPFGYRGDRGANSDCAHCEGRGVIEPRVTPSDQWSAGARALYKGIKYKPGGLVEIVTHDKLAAADQLSKLQGAYVDKSISISATMNVPAMADMSREDVHALLDSIKPS